MGVKWWFLCVLYQTIITTSFGAVKLPSTDVEVPPPTKTSTPLPAENGLASLSSPINPKLRKTILEYFKSKYLGTNQQSANMDEYSSPAVITSSSRVLPVPNIEAQAVDALPNIIPQNSILLPVPPYKSDVKFKPSVYTETSVPINNKVKLTSSPTFQNIYESTIPNGFSLPSITSLPIISLESLNRNIETLAAASNCANSLTYLPNCYPPSDNKIHFGGSHSSNLLYSLPYPLRYNQLSLPDVLTPSDVILSNLNPINNLESLRLTSPNTLKIRNNYINTLNAYPPTSIQGPYSLNLVPQSSVPINENSNSFATQRVPRVPLLVSTSPNRYLERQQFDYLNQPKQGRKMDTLCDRYLFDTLVPLPYLKSYDVLHLTSGLNLANSYYPTLSSYASAPASLRALPEPVIPDANKFSFKIPDFNFETSPLFANKLNANVDYANNDCSCNTQPTIELLEDTSIINCNIHENSKDYFTGIRTDPDLPEIPKDIPSFIPIQETPYKNGVPDISSLALPIDLSFLNTNENILPPILCENTMSDICFPPTVNYPPKLPQSVFPATYINTSPTYTLSKSSSNAISSLNHIVSTLTRSILTSFISYLTSATGKSKVPASIVPSNPYSTSTLKFHSTQLAPSPSLYNTNLMKPYTPQSLYTDITLPLNTYSATTLLPLEPLSTMSPLNVNLLPSFYDEIPSTTINLYSNDLTASTSVTSSPPLKVTLLPPTSFVDYLPSQPCPSTLPLPTLPSYLDMTTLFTTQPQFFKVKPLDRKAKTIERLLEMVFLAELMNGEGYIDWDALDTVLAILFAS